MTTLWLALDDVTQQNGAMRMLPFSLLPQSRGRNLGVAKGEETGADFFIKIEEEGLPLDRYFIHQSEARLGGCI